MATTARESSVTTERTRLHLDTAAKTGIAVVCINLAVIVWGAFVRASGSGAGCGSHWPLCDGVVIPREPDVKMLIEFSHRMSSGVAAIAVFVLAFLVFRNRPAGDPARRPAVASVALIIVEALLGAGLVLFGWVDQNASWARVVMVGLHLANTFLLLSALTLTTWRLTGAPGNRWRNNGVEGAVVWSMFALVLAVGITGAITSLGDTLFPNATLRQDFASTSHFLVRLRAFHPMLAVLTAVSVVRGSWLLTRRRSSPLTSDLSKLTTGLIIAQLVIGATNLGLHAPTPLQLIHLLMADLVWISIVVLCAAALAIAPASVRETTTIGR